MTIGIFTGKFLPPHRGHLTSIIHAATLCDKLYVIVSERKKEDYDDCMKAFGKYISGSLRKQWLNQEFQNFENIEIRLINETNIPQYPNGWEQWSASVKNLIDEHIDYVFGGEVDYIEGFLKYFPNSEYIMIDPSRSRWNVSGTAIRDNYLKYWDYIIGSARPFFTIKVLIAGTESCGKTTLTKYLAKIFHTSWSEEVGREYSKKYLGGDETSFVDEDFRRIAHLQYENDYLALRSANKVCFIDTDAVVTNYYSKLYMGKENEFVKSFIDSNRYDVVLLMKPDVKWVDDGQRFNNSNREMLHDTLKKMYIDNGFKNIIEISGNYNQRLSQALEIVENMINNGA